MNRVEDLIEAKLSEVKSKFKGLNADELVGILDKVNSDIDKLSAYANDKRMDDKSMLKKLKSLIGDLAKSMK